VRITFLGHAGLYVETRAGSVLCDPWFNPAYFGAWFPFPSNEEIDPRAIGSPDYLYVSHSHRDHLDPAFLREHVSKDATVVLPDYPVDHLERELRELGFHSFLRTRDGEPVESDGLTFTIAALVAPSDGPTGDSALVIDDGETRILNQNDAHPVDLDPLRSLGRYDAHFIQFSGAIWFPMVYAFPQRVKDALGRRKRHNEQERALRYVEEIGARHVFPCAGPPAFLDPDLFELNDFDGDPANIFVDQPAFIEYMREHGHDRGELVVPGSTIELRRMSCSVSHPMPDDAVERIFTAKRDYLTAYAERMRPAVDSIRASWPDGEVAILPELVDWFEPLLEMADLTCEAVAARVLLDCGIEQVVVDFLDRRVYRWGGEECRYRFRVDHRLVEACIAAREEDWVNSLFLSCRFEAERDGKYNEYVYNFFKCLSPERLQYAEGYYAEQSRVQELWRSDGYLIQRRCPHLKADLARFGELEGGILTCTMHGWQFDVRTGRCLTADGVRIYTEPVGEADAAEPSEPTRRSPVHGEVVDLDGG
jgi:UDP-MurNAc hydroxylase